LETRYSGNRGELQEVDQVERGRLSVQCGSYEPDVEPLTLAPTGIGRAASQQFRRIIRLNPR
jgi:hypothetical protein